MTAAVPSPGLPLLTSPTRVGAFLAQDVSDLETVDEDSLDQACSDASYIVLDYLMRDDIAGLAPEVVAAVIFVSTKVAARIYRNPRELSNYNYADLQQTYQDPRILTPDEKTMLRRARTSRLVRGPIKLTSGL